MIFKVKTFGLLIFLALIEYVGGFFRIRKSYPQGENVNKTCF